MNHETVQPVEEPATSDPNVSNPYRSPLEPYPNDPFSIPFESGDMPIQHPAPGAVPPGPVPDH